MLKNHKTHRLVDTDNLRPISTKDSREILAAIGIIGDVAVTDYHSPESISFILDDGEAIIGDLPLEAQRMPDDKEHVRNWELIFKMSTKTVYSSHAGVFKLEDQVDR